MESFVNDGHGFRLQLVQVRNVALWLLGLSGSDRVVVDKQGWLFLQRTNRRLMRGMEVLTPQQVLDWIDTMQAWCTALGKPLLCAIAGVGGLAVHKFDNGVSRGIALPTAELFPRGPLIAIETKF